MDKCDILVVGGGPAGSSFAWKIKDSGLDVIILDKERFPRDKVCAGWITPRVLSDLQINPDEYRRERTFEPISGFKTSIMGEREIYTEYGKTISYGIRRSEFDYFLLNRSGARLILGEPAIKFQRENNHWLVNGHIQASLVIGAGGPLCPVFRFMKIKRTGPVVIARETEYEMDREEEKDCSVLPHMPELYFSPDLKGYGWCFRKGKYMNIGLGRFDKSAFNSHMSVFFSSLKQRARIGRSISSTKGHTYSLYDEASEDIVRDGMLLIGDAAGLAHPQSGEGILPAVESGLMAAEIVLQNKGNYKKRHLQKYTHMLSARFRASGAIKDFPCFIPERLRLLAARKLMSTKWFSRHILLNQWFLQLKRTPLNI